MNTVSPAAFRSRDEIKKAIKAFTDANWVRLEQTAKSCAIYPVEPDQLKQEALVRALSGDRKCPSNVDVVRFLAEAIRSISDGELNKVENRRNEVSVHDDMIENLDAITPKEPGPTAEERMISNEQCQQIERKILELSDDDETAQLLIMGIMIGLEGAELREQTELDQTSFNSKRRLIRRRIDAAFPNGWTS